MDHVAQVLAGDGGVGWRRAVRGRVVQPVGPVGAQVARDLDHQVRRAHSGNGGQLEQERVDARRRSTVRNHGVTIRQAPASADFQLRSGPQAPAAGPPLSRV